MAKAPRPGTVKTRLAQSLPSNAVIALYRCLLEDTVELATSLKGVEVAVMCPAPDKDELAQFLGDGLRVVAQAGEGLVAGLTSVFSHFIRDARQRVIAFNSDSPHLSPTILENAFQILSTHDVVIGPTHDGGYYLVGAKAPHPTLFEGDGMGTASALDRLQSRTRSLKLSAGFTELFYDIDVAEDLVRLGDELRKDPKKAPRTAGWFAEWGHAVTQLKPVIGGV